MARPGLPTEARSRFWAEIRRGLVAEEAGRAAGVSPTQGRRWFRQRGGVCPSTQDPGPRRRPRLTMAQREDIAAYWAEGLSMAAIAREVGVHRSTIGRELDAGSTTFPDRQPRYRATVAQAAADRRASRARETKLSMSPALAAEVTHRLQQEHSPEQIAARLKLDFPDDEDMHLSHEAIYQSLYVQGRGELRRDLHKRLRTGRALRKTRRAVGARRGKIPDMVNIADRPPEVEDRAVPGHWEGDLIMGSTASNSAIGTLVERATRYVMLLHLPDGHGADAVQDAMVEAMSRLPQTLRRTLTWDQGREMTNHVKIAADYLDHVARKLNRRPRKTLDWHTPAEALDELLSTPSNPNGVASTA